ncbi:hypothetical protein DFQ30_009900 [Apophysomyces sp. BC1015]|nr:hypothetical protein DFQ30_009900 [Apophysomyces sp. BC1015]
MSRGASHTYEYVPACPPTASIPSQFSLTVRQQPIQTRISTNNERDRRPIDPPPIIQIRLKNATAQETHDFHQNPYFFMCANLAHPSNDDEVYTPNHNALSGQTVSSMYKLKDIDNYDGAFFIFGDLSVKVEGHFRLKFTLFEITTPGSRKRKVSDAEESSDGRVSPPAPRPRLAERHNSPSTPEMHAGHPWYWQPSPSAIQAPTPYTRRESINSNSSGTDSTGSPNVTPVSPPQQPYDQPQRFSPTTAFCSKAMPSPPHQAKPGDFLLPPPRGLDDDTSVIRLPPLRHVLPSQKRQENMGEVDAAVAMMQLHQSIIW